MSFFSKEKLKNVIRNANEIKKYTILVVDDEPANVRSLEQMLSNEYNVIIANDGMEALEIVKNHPNPESIQLIISDQRMPKKTGIEFLKETIDIIPKSIRIILTGFTDIDAIIGAINEAKVYKFISKPVEPKDLQLTVKRALEYYELEIKNIQLLKEVNELNLSLEKKVEERTKELKEAYEKLEVLSLTDTLTGLNNRRYFHEIIKKYVHSILNNEEENLAFLLLDLDFFKKVNDVYGHDGGDYILIETSNVLKEKLPDADIIRWGGEEFLIILKNKEITEIKIIAEKIRNSIAEHLFQYYDKKINQTVSIGFTTFPFWKQFPSSLTWDHILQISDIALYLAKKSGRNNGVGLFPKEEKPPFIESVYNEKITDLMENERFFIEKLIE